MLTDFEAPGLKLFSGCTNGMLQGRLQVHATTVYIQGATDQFLNSILWLRLGQGQSATINQSRVTDWGTLMEVIMSGTGYEAFMGCFGSMSSMSSAIAVLGAANMKVSTKLASYTGESKPEFMAVDMAASAA